MTTNNAAAREAKAASTTAGPNAADIIAYALKTQGVTWRLIATVHLGADWKPGNMDGGRALRAVNRAKKAGVDPAEVAIPADLAAALKAAGFKGELRAEAPAKPPRKPRARKAATMTAEAAREQVEDAPSLPVVEDEPVAAAS